MTAEELFLAHLLANHGLVHLTLLQEKHPEHAQALQDLTQRWDALVRGSSLYERLRQRKPPEVLWQAPGQSAEGSATPASPATSLAAGPSSNVRARLERSNPASQRYRLESEIARGGMGAILRVWDEDLRRTLAMKVALTRATKDKTDKETIEADSRLIDRFLEEAQITGQLDHPGVVPVHELGLDAEGRVYFTMRLVKGLDLKQVLELLHEGKEGWNRTRALGVMLKVCEAMAFAHEKGVIHRDLKPANIMVGRLGETYVMDWGLARVLGEKDKRDLRLRENPSSLTFVRTHRAEERTHDSPLVTMDGDIVGTPCYMPPEQARGRLEEIGPHSDVYSAGAILYQLLTGEMPYVKRDEKIAPHTVLALLLAGPPTPLTAMDRRIPEELVAICEKAMAREPAGRYASMLEMAEDLRAYLEDRVVRAHESGSLAEFRKWIRRNRAAALASAAAVTLAVAGLVTIVLLQARSNDRLVDANEEIRLARDQAVAAQNSLVTANNDLEQARDRANHKAREAARSEYAASIAAASASLRLMDAADAGRRLLQCEETLRGFEWHHLKLATDPILHKLLLGAQPLKIACDPTGQWIAVGCSDDRIVLLHPESDKAVLTIAVQRGFPGVLGFSPDGSRLAGAGRDGKVYEYSLVDGSVLRSFGEHDGSIAHLAYSPDGSRLATGTTDKKIHVWRTSDASLEHKLEAHRGGITALAFDPSGQRLASGSRDRIVLIWDLQRGDVERRLDEGQYPVAVLGFAPDGNRLLVGHAQVADDDGEMQSHEGHTLRLWDLRDGSLLGMFDGPRDKLVAGGFRADGRVIFGASRDATIWLWDLESGEEQVLLGHRREVVDATFLPGSPHLVSCGSDSDLRLWNPSLRLGFAMRGHAARVSALCFVLDGKRVISASNDHSLRVWNAQTGLVDAVLRGHSEPVLDVCANKGGTLIVSTSTDRTAILWDPQTGELLWRIGEAQGNALARNALDPFLCAAFDPTKPLLYIADAGGSLSAYDLSTKELVSEFQWGQGQPTRLSVSTDGKQILLASESATQRSVMLTLLDSSNGSAISKRNLPQRPGGMVFAPDGTPTLSLGAQIYRLSPVDLSNQTTFLGHEQSIATLAYSADGSRLASGGGDDAIRIWDVESQLSLLTLPSSSGEVLDLTFDPGERTLAAACGDRSVMLWSTSLPNERDREQRQEQASRNSVLAMLDSLFERFADPAVILERLRTDPGLEAQRLRSALTLARLVPTDARAADREFWRAVRAPNIPAEDVHLAYWSALVANHVAPQNERTLRLLGAALYRLGRLEQAIAALEQSNELRLNRSRVEVQALLAMAKYRSGQIEAAEGHYRELLTLMQIPTALLQLENQVLLRETERVRGKR